MRKTELAAGESPLWPDGKEPDEQMIEDGALAVADVALHVAVYKSCEAG